MRIWLIDFIRRLLICCAVFMAVAVLFPAVEHHNPPRQPSQQETHQDALEADREWQQAYGRMSDRDKMAGVVFEPVDGE